MLRKIIHPTTISVRNLSGACFVGGGLFLMAAMHAAFAQPAASVATSPAISVVSPFELVLIDSASEKQFGGFPIDRAIMAKAVIVLKQAGARAVVLKFFYDQPGQSPESDKALADAMSRIKTLLQARIDEAELQANPLPARFITGAVTGNFKSSLTGTSGWVPLAPFAAAAADIGFVDIASPDSVPMIESYQNKPVKSLTLAALEIALGETAKIEGGTRITLGKRSVALTDDNQVSLKLASVALPDYVPLAVLLDGKINRAILEEKFRDKVVVIGYDGEKMHFLTTNVGMVKAHRLFYLGLLEVYRQLK